MRLNNQLLLQQLKILKILFMGVGIRNGLHPWDREIHLCNPNVVNSPTSGPKSVIIVWRFKEASANYFRASGSWWRKSGKMQIDTIYPRPVPQSPQTPWYLRPTTYILQTNTKQTKNTYTTYYLGSLTCAVWLFLVHPCAAFAGGEVRCPTILDFS